MTTRSAFVTGGASGIGLAVAHRLAAAGYSVALVDLDGSKVEEAAGVLRSEGHRALGLQADVVDLDAMVSAAQAAADEHGPMRAVASCAGIESMGTVLDTSSEVWQRTLDVNLTGVFHTAKAVFPFLLATQGAFVAVSSDAGTEGSQGFAAYTASKHGVIGLVRCLALDYGPSGVRSNVVAPALVETPMAERIFEGISAEEKDFFRAAVPLGRFARADEVANVVEHLLSESASYTNGLVYAIDGGSTVGYFRP